MRRQLYFDYSPAENDYIIQEDDTCIFRISGKTLKFVSLEFYNGIYAGNKSTAIDFENRIAGKDADPLNKGCYIFDWIKEIFKTIEEELPESDGPDPKYDEQIDNTPEHEVQVEFIDKGKRLIRLFDWPACAGDGFYFDQSNVPFRKIEAENDDADYAVRISGKSMEPTIEDGTIVMVKKVDSLSDGEIGIFSINGEIMCKRYCVEGTDIVLKPDNPSEEFSTIDASKGECVLQGKVLLE